MYLTRILSSIVFVVFASTSLAVKPENTLRPGKTIKQDRCTSTESAPVAAMNVDPDRDAVDCVVRPDTEGRRSLTAQRKGGGKPKGKAHNREIQQKESQSAYHSMREDLKPKKRTTVKSQITPEESASVVAVNVDPDRDGCKVGREAGEAQERSTPAPEYSKTQGMNVTSRMVALRGGVQGVIKADASEECVER